MAEKFRVKIRYLSVAEAQKTQKNILKEVGSQRSSSCQPSEGRKSTNNLSLSWLVPHLLSEAMKLSYSADILQDRACWLWSEWQPVTSTLTPAQMQEHVAFIPTMEDHY